MEKLEKIPSNDIDKWQKMLVEKLPSEVLREIANKYGVGKTELAMMLEDIYSSVDLKEIQAIWSWGINSIGKGLGDADLNKIIGGLKIKE